MNPHGLKVRLTQAAMLGALMLGSSAQPQQGAATAQPDGFLSDYSKLTAAGDNPFDELYIAPGAVERAGKYDAVMVDQPEIFIHPDSKYKGAKPDDLKLIADGLREAVSRELRGAYQIVDQPGPNVLLVRLAVGDLIMQKRKRSILAYTPVGAVVHATKNALTSDMTNKVDLKNMKIEGEVLDSQTQEQLAAMTTSRGSLSTNAAKSDAVSWNELETDFSIIGKRLRCRLDNARIAKNQQQECGQIGLAAATEGVASEAQKR